MKQNFSMPEIIPSHTTTERATDAPPAAGEASGSTPVEEQAAGLDERMMLALQAASDKKAIDLVALNLRDIASFTDYFLLASGANARQVQAIADEIVERLKRRGTPAARVEGYNGAEWILIDYGDFVVHIFEQKARRFYDLERLWRDARRVQLPPELASEHAPDDAH
jgi:ribosome-associated protein